MNENQAWKLIVDMLERLMTSSGMPAVVQRGYQPTEQGVPLEPVLYLYDIAAPRFGWQSRDDVWNAEAGDFDHVESWFQDLTIQCGALVPPGVQGENDLTALDYVSHAAAILQSDIARTMLLNYGVGILRITDVRSTYFRDDTDRNEQAPSFDFTLTRQQSITFRQPPIDRIDLDLKRV